MRDDAARRRAYEAISCTGAIVPLDVFGDTAEVRQIRVVLFYDRGTGLVLRGPRRGQSIQQAELREVCRLLEIGNPVRCRRTVLRPWWRLWQKTPALVMTLGVPPALQ